MDLVPIKTEDIQGQIGKLVYAIGWQQNTAMRLVKMFGNGFVLEDPKNNNIYVGRFPLAYCQDKE